MPHVRLGVSVPAGTWVRDVSTDHPSTTFRVVAILPADERAVALIELDGPRPVPALAAIDAHPVVTDLELLRSDDERTLVQVETAAPKLLGPLRAAGVPLATPFDVRDGEATWELTSTDDRLSALGDRLDEAGVRYRLDAVTPAAGPADGDGFTDRQREALVAAYEQGYYATPRSATLTEVADGLGVSKSTASDLLHRAEGHLVDQYVAKRRTSP